MVEADERERGRRSEEKSRRPTSEEEADEARKKPMTQRRGRKAKDAEKNKENKKKQIFVKMLKGKKV